LKHLVIFIVCISICVSSFSQYYLRGIVQDENGKGLSNVSLRLQSKGGYPFSTGVSGTFGIPCNSLTDTITLQAEGFETLRQGIITNQFQTLKLKMLAATANKTKHYLISVTKNKLAKPRESFYGGESYSAMIENDFVETNRFPETGFALNVDRASYSNIRRFLNMDSKVLPDAVRIEEMLNYFSFVDDSNTSRTDFTCQTQLTDCPWNSANKLLYINLHAPEIDVSKVPPTNLVFLIDVSGSMDDANRLPLLQSAFKMLVHHLREQDTVAIVVYGGNVGVWLQPTSGKEKTTINKAIDQLTASGETPGAQAITTAYALAERSFNPRAVNRVILATDGDFNVGQTSEKELEELITAHKQSNIYLTCLGVGMGNYKDSKLEVLATKGNGNFAYLDNLYEAQKVMITEFTKTLYTVADDAFAGITFESALVKQYKLIGFDNKVDALQDNSSQLDGGEVGSGHSTMAVFEITLKNNAENTSGSIGNIQLKYFTKDTKQEQKQLFNVPLNYQALTIVPNHIKLATAIVMFGELLKHNNNSSDYNYTWDDIIKLASPAVAPDNYAESEFVSLVEKAKRIYAVNKRKKKDGDN
jgi:Ca-activated chloride channel family protein